MPSLGERVAEHDREIADVKKKVDEMHAEFLNVRGAFVMLDRIAGFLKAILYVAAFISAGYVFIKTGVWKAP